MRYFGRRDLARLVLLRPVYREFISERELKTLRDSPWPVRQASHPMELNRDVPVPEWNGEEDRKIRRDLMDREKRDSVKLFD